MLPHISSCYDETQDFHAAGYTYFKGEFRRQYLSEDITRREQEALSFLERIDADIPSARQEFRAFWLSTAAEIKKYMNVSRFISRGERLLNCLVQSMSRCATHGSWKRTERSS
jgi:hypothetical protein